MNDNRKGEILRDAQRQAAIVSPIPGTTRDVIEVSLNIGGYPIVIGDTAGLRQTDDLIEIEGISRAKKWCLSCETGEGFKEFLDEFVNLLKTKYDSSTSQVALITQTRH
ncbi:21874_t:CDS:2, partial [Entrophospora sp. SA101]